VRQKTQKCQQEEKVKRKRKLNKWINKGELFLHGWWPFIGWPQFPHYGILLPLAEHSVVVNSCLLFELFVSCCSSTSVHIHHQQASGCPCSLQEVLSGLSEMSLYFNLPNIRKCNLHWGTTRMRSVDTMKNTSKLLSKRWKTQEYYQLSSHGTGTEFTRTCIQNEISLTGYKRTIMCWH